MRKSVNGIFCKGYNVTNNLKKNGTFKIFCIVTEYKDSKPEDIPNEIIDLLKTIQNENGLFRLNKPKSKGQYSLTKRKKDLIGKPIGLFSKEYKVELESARKLFKNHILDVLDQL